MPAGPAPADLDRFVHAAQPGFTAGLSPTSTALAVLDWAVHLGGSPGKQQEPPLTNPEVLNRSIREGGANLRRGAAILAEDWSRLLAGRAPVGRRAFRSARRSPRRPGPWCSATG